MWALYLCNRYNGKSNNIIGSTTITENSIVTKIPVIYQLLVFFRDFKYDESISSAFLMGGFSFTFGVLYLVFGVVLIRLKYLTGKIANYAGIFSIITGCCFLTLIGSILAFIFLVPLVLSEIIMLYRVAETIQTKQKESGEASPSIPFSWLSR